MSIKQGTTGIVGGYAPLDSGLLVPRSYLPQISGLLHKMDATTAPTVNDDSDDGYGIGSRWLDITNDMEYVCTDASVGAAIWLLTASKLTSYTPTWTSDGSAPAIGNGSISGSYLVLAPGLVLIRIAMDVGSTSTIGTGNYRWSVPSGFTIVNLEVGGVAAYRDASTAQRGYGTCLAAGTTTIGVRANTPAINSSEWSATYPVNPVATSDNYQIKGIWTYT